MNSVTKPSRATRWIRVGIAGLSSLVVVAGVSSGCLNRPVEEQEPSTSNVFVTQFAQTAVDKIDLLFMIDNSQSMADKQQILAAAVPQLVNRLLNPPCVDDNGNAVGAQPTSPAGECTEGSREFEPISDVHIGVISSSLGGVGGPFCEESGTDNWNTTMVDMAHLMGTVRTLTTAAPEGFLNWDNRDAAVKAGDTIPDAEAISDLATLKTRFTEHVIAAGELGCGFEASLEAWYRFLIDPAPYASVEIPDPGTSQGVKTGVDQAILDQRAMFLRGDSLVAVIMLTDENDCSIKAGGLGNLVTTFTRNNNQFLMRRGTSVCDSNPNDPCCFSCATADASWNTACGTKDQLCQGPDGTTAVALTAAEDASNLRCFQQKQRFGIDLLYPTSRYSVGLSQLQLCENGFGDNDCTCTEAQKLGASCSPGDAVTNPLYSSGTAIMARDPSLVFLAGIVGVPWQLIATEDTNTTATSSLRYKIASQIDWLQVVGDPDTNVKPSSPYMVESIEARPDLPGVDSGSPTADPINGHEWNTENRDLQYACIFPLITPTDCTTVGEGKNCDCMPSEGADPLADVDTAKKPLCQSDSGAYTTTQYRAKAYPGLRELEVLKDYKDNAIVASVCPKTLSGTAEDPSYGYNPAVSAIVDRLKEKLGGKCLPRALEVDETTQLVPCEVVEAMPEGTCSCDPAKGRIDLTDKPALINAVHAQLRDNLACETTDKPQSCDSFCMCGIQQYGADNPADRELCLNNAGESLDVSSPGYCYIDAMDPNGNYIGNPDLVANCEDSQKRLLRFVGDNTPARGSITFIACSGERIR